jgi:uncharacterized protein
MDWALTAAGLGVGVIVGLTGMGGGALMTPVLVIFFHIPPLAAVSSDLVASAVMKPFGSLVHIRAKRVDWRLVGWLCAGSVPFAFTGVLLARSIGGDNLQNIIKIALGCALMLAVAGLLIRAYMQMREHAADARSGSHGAAAPADGTIQRVRVKPIPTLLLGAAGGLVVGMTSVGSGSLIIVALLALYPMLRPGDLVGTDLVQAVPLVASAALGQFIFGDFRFDVTFPLLLGAIPGVIVGAQISARGQSGLIRRALAIVLFASALKLLNATNTELVVGVAAAIVLGPIAWALLRRSNGLPALARNEAPVAAPAPPAPSSAGAELLTGPGPHSPGRSA